MSCPYAVLKIPRDSSLTEVKAQYKRLALLVHPDRGGSKQAFDYITDAYKTILEIMEPQYRVHAEATGPDASDAMVSDMVRGFDNWVDPFRAQRTAFDYNNVLPNTYQDQALTLYDGNFGIPAGAAPIGGYTDDHDLSACHTEKHNYADLRRAYRSDPGDTIYGAISQGPYQQQSLSGRDLRASRRSYGVDDMVQDEAAAQAASHDRYIQRRLNDVRLRRTEQGAMHRFLGN